MMKQEINPKDTKRAQAFEMWMKSPMPMVTLTKTFNVTPDFGDASPCSHVRQLANSGNFGYARQ